MKRILAITLSVLMLVCLLCACSGTATISDVPDDSYGNVSTTDNGRVNGTNDRMKGTTGSADSSSGYTTYGNTTGTYSSTTAPAGSSGSRTAVGTNGSSASNRAAGTTGSTTSSGTGMNDMR